MAPTPTLRIVRPALTSAPTDAVLSFLAPSLQCTQTPVSRFSTSRTLWKRDNNKNRGLSAVRHTGPRPRQTLSVKRKDYANQQLPTPVERTTKIEGDPDHGLWEFFKDRKLLRTPVEESRHGRAWTVNELRDRDWETLQQQWWVCVKERNRLATEKLERLRQKAGFGDDENETRDKTVQQTMKAIIDTLVERNNAYQEAFELARHDPTIDLTRPEHQYQPPSPYEVDEMYEESLDDPAGAVPQEVLEQQSSKSAHPSIEEPASSTDRSKKKTNIL